MTTTTEDLSKKLMQDCRTSELPLLDQATALGTAYACYLVTKGVTGAELHGFIDQALKVIDEIARKASVSPPSARTLKDWNQSPLN